MKIEAPQKNKIVVELTDDDMSELDITYEQMDYSNIETRRVIWTLLDRARTTLGRDIDPSGKMLIEAVPKPTGGCVIYFTVMDDMRSMGVSKNVLQIKKESAVNTYEFESLNALMDCAVTLKKSGFNVPESSLFSFDGKYRLSVVSDSFSRPVGGIFREFGSLCGEGRLFVEFMKEHGKILAEGDALRKLAP